MTDDELIETMALEIEAARQRRPYGLYDYSTYVSTTAQPAHVVRDERDGSVVLRTNDPELAKQTYEALSRQYVARAALAAIRNAGHAVLPVATVEAVLSATGEMALGCLAKAELRAMIAASKGERDDRP